MLLRAVGFTLFIFMLTGCSSHFKENETKQAKPLWLTQVNYIKNKRSAVGCSEIHVKGFTEQKKLAVSRAIEQIALQKNTKVKVVTYRQDFNNHIKSSKTSSLQEVSHNISTKVVDEYVDKNSRLCVLVVEE